MTKRLLIIGASGHGKVLCDIALAAGNYDVAGFLDRDTTLKAWRGVPVLGSDDALHEIVAAQRVDAVVVAIGDNWVRSQVAERISRAAGIPFATLVHPSAIVCGGARIGAGSVVMAGAVVGVDTVIGEHCIMNTSASLDHENVLGDFASVGPGVVTGGKVTIGRCSAVGIGATILQGRSVGDHAVVGAAALVDKDVTDSVVAYGVPARVLRKRAVDEPYLRVSS